jgi:Tol biopolymer transport system component
MALEPHDPYRPDAYLPPSASGGRGRLHWAVYAGMGLAVVVCGLLALGGFALVRAVEEMETQSRGPHLPSFAVAPRGGFIVFSGRGRGGSDLYSMSLDSLQVRALVADRWAEDQPSFSADGRTLVYVGSRGYQPGRIFMRDMDSGRTETLTRARSSSDYAPTLSPDGRTLVFARSPRYSQEPGESESWWTDWDLYAMDLKTRSIRRLTRAEYGRISAPRVTPDGKSVLYSASAKRSNQMERAYMTALDRSAPPRVLDRHIRAPTPRCVLTCDPDLSRDGRRMVFLSDRAAEYDYDVYLADAQLRETKRLTRKGDYMDSPLFTADGRRILFLTDPHYDDRYELWEVGLDGSGLRRLADPRLFESPLHWSPRQ